MRNWLKIYKKLTLILLLTTNFVSHFFSYFNHALLLRNGRPFLTFGTQLHTVGAFANLRGVGRWGGKRAKSNRQHYLCYLPTLLPQEPNSDQTPYLSGKDYKWLAFPNNLLLNFPADWPSSSTAYMLSQGDSTPGPTLERLSHQYYSANLT